MAFNSLGPTTAAAVGEAQGFDQLASEIDSENSSAAGMSQDTLVGTIKAHIAAGDKAKGKVEEHYAAAAQAKGKAQQHFLAAGLHLKTLKKQHTGSWAEWAKLLKAKIGISTGRVSELMQLADGRKTVEGLRSATAERNADLRRRKKTSSSRDEEFAAFLRTEKLKADTKKEERQKRTLEEVEYLASKLIELDRDTAPPSQPSVGRRPRWREAPVDLGTQARARRR